MNLSPGGVLFFALARSNGVISDYNHELTNLYQVVKLHPKALILDLDKHINTKEYYYSIRSLDRNPIAYNSLSSLTKASRFLYLNKTGFNGLYRVNRQGQNNVPFGYYKNPNIVNKVAILACSKQLQDTTILTGDFTNISDRINPGDFVYLDPPYVPLSTSL